MISSREQVFHKALDIEKSIEELNEEVANIENDI